MTSLIVRWFAPMCNDMLVNGDAWLIMNFVTAERKELQNYLSFLSKARCTVSTWLLLSTATNRQATVNLRLYLSTSYQSPKNYSTCCPEAASGGWADRAPKLGAMRAPQVHWVRSRTCLAGLCMQRCPQFNDLKWIVSTCRPIGLNEAPHCKRAASYRPISSRQGDSVGYTSAVNSFHVLFVL